MPTQGPNFPTSTTGTDAAWTNPNNIEAADGVFAVSRTMDPVTFTTSGFLVGTGFGFSIPAGVKIQGIKLEVNYKDANTPSPISENNVQILKAGSAVGTDHSTGASLPTTATTVSYGGASDLWGTSWTPSDINASNFGARVQYQDSGSSNDNASVDFLRITVSYTANPGFFAFF